MINHVTLKYGDMIDDVTLDLGVYSFFQTEIFQKANTLIYRGQYYRFKSMLKITTGNCIIYYKFFELKRTKHFNNRFPCDSLSRSLTLKFFQNLSN